MREGSDRISARIDPGLPVEPVAMRDGNARLEAREAPAMAARTRPGRSPGDGVDAHVSEESRQSAGPARGLR